MRALGYAVAFGAVVMMTNATPAPPEVTGQWGGPGARLTLDASGGRIEYECAAGTVDAPVRLDAQGRFSVDGKHEEYTTGPTPAERAPATRAARYEGRVDGDQMALTVRIAGDKSLRAFNLVHGQRIKLIRCL